MKKQKQIIGDRRRVFTLDGEQWVFASSHPKEERIRRLSACPRDEHGSIILPDEPWDGVETCPGIMLSAGPGARRRRPLPSTGVH